MTGTRVGGGMGSQMAPLDAQPCIWEVEGNDFVGQVGRERVATKASDEGVAVVS